MSVTRRDLALAGAIAFGGASLLQHSPALAEGDEAAVNQAVESLRQAMVAGDQGKLAALAHDKLSYGHSSGRLENKAQFIEALTNRKSTIKSLTFGEPSVAVVGGNAIARHIFSAEIERDGKISTPKVGVMQVWLKDGGWKLLARQAFTLA